MSIICPNCNYDKNPPGTEFCEACGSEIGASAAYPPPQIEIPTPIPPPNQVSYPDPTPIPPPTQVNYPNSIPDPRKTQPIYPPAPLPINPPSNNIFTSTAKLICKQPGAPFSEFPLDSNNAIVGRFDPDSGPVDIDLERFPGEETISRNHAEIYQENGQWKVKDLGSTNGVFIKRSGQPRFGARITLPESLNSGDEIAFGKLRFLFEIS